MESHEGLTCRIQKSRWMDAAIVKLMSVGNGNQSSARAVHTDDKNPHFPNKSGAKHIWAETSKARETVLVRSALGREKILRKLGIKNSRVEDWRRSSQGSIFR